MIVIIGVPRSGRGENGEIFATGRAVAIARAAVAAGADVEIAGRIGDDSHGDAAVLDLATHGIGHAALLRVGGLTTLDTNAEPAPGLDAGDVELALHYLPGYRVVVVADELDDAALGATSEAASWAGAHLVVITATERKLPAMPDASTVLAVPDAEASNEPGGAHKIDPDVQPEGDRGGDAPVDAADAFAAFVGAYAAAIDRGTDPSRAFSDLAALFNPERVDR